MGTQMHRIALAFFALVLTTTAYGQLPNLDADNKLFVEYTDWCNKFYAAQKCNNDIGELKQRNHTVLTKLQQILAGSAETGNLALLRARSGSSGASLSSALPNMLLLNFTSTFASRLNQTSSS